MKINYQIVFGFNDSSRSRMKFTCSSRICRDFLRKHLHPCPSTESIIPYSLVLEELDRYCDRNNFPGISSRIVLEEIQILFHHPLSAGKHKLTARLVDIPDR